MWLHFVFTPVILSLLLLIASVCLVSSSSKTHHTVHRCGKLFCTG
uniref:Uncharacterized protein n=1 Tax=Rhizophora mucronata TaxID=61149 RepID=A0A2P2NV88_RHIMU